MEHVTFVEGRGNLLLEYASEGAEGTVAFVGSHLDVVPANPETWERNPFKLTVEVSTYVLYRILSNYGTRLTLSYVQYRILSNYRTRKLFDTQYRFHSNY